MQTTNETDFPLSVLVVDDNEDTATSLATLLAMLGYSTRPSVSAVEALLAAAADPPDVVFLDLLMPGMDGWELARRLRDQATEKQPLLVAVSGCWKESDRWRSADAGIDLHLVKPVEPAVLVGLLKRFAKALAPASENLLSQAAHTPAVV